MCEPTTVAVAAVGLGVAGGIMRGRAEQQALDARADANERNAQLAKQAAADALARGEQDAWKVMEHGEQVAGKQRTAYAGMGVEVGQGSAGIAEQDTAMLTQYAVDIARNNAAREAWGLERQGDNFLAEAARERDQADNALASNIIGGALGGFSNALGSGAFRRTPPSSAPTVPGSA